MSIARQIPSGMVHINDQTINSEPFAPFGGVGDSGNGARHGGPSNIDEFTQWQWLTIKEEASRHAFWDNPGA
jgi:benzaldehyde dehydrogenase (NAD)